MADRIVTDAMLTEQHGELHDSLDAVALAVGRMRAENGRMRAALIEIRAAIVATADDVAWMPDGSETIVDRITDALGED
jgi:uncharacterized membrane protein